MKWPSGMVPFTLMTRMRPFISPTRCLIILLFTILIGDSGIFFCCTIVRMKSSNTFSCVWPRFSCEALQEVSPQASAFRIDDLTAARRREGRERTEAGSLLSDAGESRQWLKHDRNHEAEGLEASVHVMKVEPTGFPDR